MARLGVPVNESIDCTAIGSGLATQRLVAITSQEYQAVNVGSNRIQFARTFRPTWSVAAMFLVPMAVIGAIWWLYSSKPGVQTWFADRATTTKVVVVIGLALVPVILGFVLSLIRSGESWAATIEEDHRHIAVRIEGRVLPVILLNLRDGLAAGREVVIDPTPGVATKPVKAPRTLAPMPVPGAPPPPVVAPAAPSAAAPPMVQPVVTPASASAPPPVAAAAPPPGFAAPAAPPPVAATNPPPGFAAPAAPPPVAAAAPPPGFGVPAAPPPPVAAPQPPVAYAPPPPMNPGVAAPPPPTGWAPAAPPPAVAPASYPDTPPVGAVSPPPPAPDDEPDIYKTTAMRPAFRGVEVPRPPVLEFDDGARHVCAGVVLIGRDPAAEPANAGAAIIRIDDPERTVSKTHLEVRPSPDGGVTVVDRGSTNGSNVQAADGVLEALEPRQEAHAGAGSRVYFGARSFLVAEDRG